MLFKLYPKMKPSERKYAHADIFHKTKIVDENIKKKKDFIWIYLQRKPI